MSTTGLDSQVLTVLARTKQYLTIQQIHQLLPEGGSPQGTRKATIRLAERGTVLERVTGRSHADALNREHLLVGALHQISNAKDELVSRMAHVISTWQVQPITVHIFGSAARNQMRTDSDIDLLVVMPDNVADETMEEQVSCLVSQTNRWTGNDVRPLIYHVSEIEPARIFGSIIEESIDVAGDPAWLRRQLRTKAET